MWLTDGRLSAGHRRNGRGGALRDLRGGATFSAEVTRSEVLGGCGGLLLGFGGGLGSSTGVTRTGTRGECGGSLLGPGGLLLVSGRELASAETRVASRRDSDGSSLPAPASCCRRQSTRRFRLNSCR